MKTTACTSVLFAAVFAALFSAGVGQESINTFTVHVAPPNSGNYPSTFDDKMEAEKAFIGAELQRELLSVANRDPHSDSTVSQSFPSCCYSLNTIHVYPYITKQFRSITVLSIPSFHLFPIPSTPTFLPSASIFSSLSAYLLLHFPTLSLSPPSP